MFKKYCLSFITFLFLVGFFTSGMLSVYAAPKPDLHIEGRDITITPMKINALEQITVYARVYNRGDFEVKEAVVSFQFLYNNVTVMEYSRYVYNLKPYSSERVGVHWRPQVPGNYMVKVVIDPKNIVDEATKENNIAQASFIVGEKDKPDLSIIPENIFIEPAKPRSGEQVHLSARIYNLGNAPAEPFRVSFQIYREDRLVAEFTKNSIRAVRVGRWVGVSVNWTPTHPGPYLVKVLIDPKQDVEEVNRSNNEASKLVFIESGYLPDLSVNNDAIVINPEVPVENDRFSITVTVRNNGRGIAKDIPVSLQILKDDEVISEDKLRIDQIEPGRFNGVEFPLKYFKPGKYTVRVVLDPENLVKKVSVDNLKAERSFMVMNKPTPDIYINPEDITITPPNPNKDQDVTIKAIIRNKPYNVTAYHIDVVFQFLYNDQIFNIVDKKIDALPSGEGAVITFTTEAFKKPGLYKVRVILDPYNKIEERDKANNVTQKEFVVE